MTVIVIPHEAKRPLEVGRFVRNDRPPLAAFQKQLAELAGYCAGVRSHVLFRSRGSLTIPTSAAGSRTRARVAFHSGPFASTVIVRFVMAYQNNGAATAPYARFRITTTDGSVVGDCVAQFGASASVVSDVPGNFGERTIQLKHPTSGANAFLDQDTDYYAELTEHDYARVHSIVVREVSLNPDTNNGYAPLVSVGGPIFETDRATPATMGRLLNRRGSAHLWNWWAETDALAPTFATSTYTNIIDETSTTVSSFRPGATLDLRNRARHKDAGMVPVVMKVYGSATVGGSVRLRNSDGDTMLDAAVGTVAGWSAVAGMLPATLAKYDLHAAAASGSVTPLAVSIYRLDGAAVEALADGPAYMRGYAFDGTASMS